VSLASELVRTQISYPTPGNCDSAGLGCGPQICISVKVLVMLRLLAQGPHPETCCDEVSASAGVALSCNLAFSCHTLERRGIPSQEDTLLPLSVAGRPLDSVTTGPVANPVWEVQILF
jgi:hypothetical protein